MNTQLTLTDSEFQLVRDLLQAERNNLAPEIHHTMTPNVKESLHERLKLVENLIDRLRHGPTA